MIADSTRASGGIEKPMHRQGRILVVDDEVEWRDELVEILTDNNFYGQGAASISEALKALEESFFHLIILDIGMKKSDNNDRGGFTLLRELKQRRWDKTIGVIMLSGQTALEVVRTSFHDYEVIDFLQKQNFTRQSFVQEVNSFFNKRLPLNFELQIRQPRGLQEQILTQLQCLLQKYAYPVHDNTLAYEIDDLLCRLFYRAHSILIQPLKTPSVNATILKVDPLYDTGAGRSVIVRLDSSQAVQEEQWHVDNHVKRHMGSGRDTLIDGYCRTPHVGGVCYSLQGVVDDQVENFESFYRHNASTTICRALDNLFLETCTSWYASLGTLQHLDLVEEYEHVLEVSPEALAAMISPYRCSSQEGSTLSFAELPQQLGFPDPLLTLQNANFLYPTYRCITHGGITPHTLLVDKAQHTWLIDFQHTQPGHFLRDIAMLDCGIRFQLLESKDATLAERLEMEQHLCSIERFEQLQDLKTNVTFSNPAVAKAFTVVVHLRLLAYSILIPAAIHSEYYVALFYHALACVARQHLPIGIREHALLSASLLTATLD